MLNAKRFNAQNLSKCIFRASRKTFSYFRRLHWIMVGVLQYLLEFSHYSVSSSSMQDLRWSSLWQKIWNGWKLFLTVATESFILYVAGFLELTQGIDNFRLRQVFHPAITCSNTKKKKNTKNVSSISKVNMKDTRTSVASIVNSEHILHFILLLLLLNSNKCWLGLRIYSFRQ